MAHRILGIDLGTFSVKVADLMVGFRQVELVGLHERRLMPALPPPIPGFADSADVPESHVERAVRTLKVMIDELGLRADMFAASMGGQEILRLITVPLTDPKKIEQVLGYELESQILEELDLLVFDSIVSAAHAESTQVLAVAATRSSVVERVEGLTRVGCEPRLIGSAALAPAALAPHAWGELAGVPHLIVDIGHTQTIACCVDEGRVLFARTIGRGGQDVTLALEDTFRMQPEEAEVAKHRQAFILAPGKVADSPEHTRVDACVKEAVRPLVRELRQTLAAIRAAGHPLVEEVLLTGGGAKLNGIVEHLALELDLPTVRLGINPGELEPEPLDGAAPRGALARFLRKRPGVAPAAPRVSVAPPDRLHAHALGLALALARPAPQINLRRGELSFRADFSYARSKAGYLVAAVLTILAFAAVNAAASLRGLRKDSEALEARLRVETTALFGEPRLDGKAVSEELLAGPHGAPPPMPQLTAYDVLDEISRHVPLGDKIKLDVQEIDIKPKKVFIKGTVDSAQQVDDLAGSLEKIECFSKVVKGKISTVAGQAAPPPAPGEKPDDTKPAEVKAFTLDIEAPCL